MSLGGDCLNFINLDTLIFNGLCVSAIKSLLFLPFDFFVGFLNICYAETPRHMWLPQFENKILKPALKLNLGLVLCAETFNVGNAVKPIIIIIIIPETPWRPEDGVHHSPPSIFPAGLFPPTGQLQSGGYRSVEL